MEDKIPTVSLFGSCAVHISFKSIPHKRACGLVNWVNLITPRTKIFDKVDESFLESYNFSKYSKRVLYLNFNKIVIDYLLQEKSDYLILSCDDNRRQLINDKTSDVFSVVTDFTQAGETLAGFDKLVNDVFENPDNYEMMPCYDVDFSYYELAAHDVCTRILDVYQPNEIVLVEAKPVEFYCDDKGIHRFTLAENGFNQKSQEVVGSMFDLIKRHINGIHVIEFPENVIAGGNHSLGLHPLHYHPYFYEYVEKAAKIIFSKTNCEASLLFQLKELYSFKFKCLMNDISMRSMIKNMRCEFDLFRTDNDTNTKHPKNITYILRSVSDFDTYLDYLNAHKSKLIVLISVKDSCGFYSNYQRLNSIHNLGFRNYPNKLWMTYIGIMVNGKTILDISSRITDDGKVMEETLEYSTSFTDLSLNLVSSPFRVLNVSKIVVNGTNYSMNFRGLNMVVIDSDSNVVVDSISFDSHWDDYFLHSEAFVDH